MRAKPDWLDLKRYRFAQKLKAPGWRWHLRQRLDAQRAWRVMIKTRAVTPDKQEFFWKSHLEEILPQEPATAQEDEAATVQEDNRQNVLPVYELQAKAPPDVPQPETLLPCVELPYDFIASDSMRLVAIDLDVANGDIIEAFKTWLLVSREHYPGPLRPRRGPEGSRNTYRAAHGKEWHEYRVLTILDLDLWFEIHGQRRTTLEEIGIWLSPGNYKGDPVDWGCKARKRLRRAVESIDALDAAELVKTSR